MHRLFTRIGFLSVVLAVLAVPAMAQQSAGGASLFISPSARADGMGRAFVSIADDPSATWWNPAGLGFQKEASAMTNYAKLVPDLADDVFHLYLAYVHHSSSWGTFGGSFVYLSYGTSQVTQSDNGNGGTAAIDSFTSYEMAPTLSFGTALNDNVALGFSVKLLYVNLAPGNALKEAGVGTAGDIKGSGSSVAADFGILLRDSLKVGERDLEIGAGAALQNLGPSISFVDQANSDPLPRNLHIGVHGSIGLQEGYKLTVAGNLQQPLVNKRDRGIWHAGAELVAAGTLAGRVGWIGDPDGDIEAATFGLGIMISNFQLDFASVPQATGLARVKKFGLRARF